MVSVGKILILGADDIHAEDTFKLASFTFLWGDSERRGRYDIPQSVLSRLDE